MVTNRKIIFFSTFNYYDGSVKLKFRICNWAIYTFKYFYYIQFNPTLSVISIGMIIVIEIILQWIKFHPNHQNIQFRCLIFSKYIQFEYFFIEKLFGNWEKKLNKFLFFKEIIF